MLPVFVGLGAAVGTTASEETPDTTPPSGPPTNASAYTYGGSLIGVQWTNGDSTAETEIARTTAALIEPTSRDYIVPPTETAFQTGETERCYWWVRHRKNSQYSTWVLALHELGCSSDSEDGDPLL